MSRRVAAPSDGVKSTRSGWAASTRRSARSHPLTLVRLRGDQYRLDFELLGGPAVRARVAETAWWQHSLLQPEPVPVGEHPYKGQTRARVALRTAAARGRPRRASRSRSPARARSTVVATIDIKVTLPDGQEGDLAPSTRRPFSRCRRRQPDLRLSPSSRMPPRREAFFSDFREVDGLVLPFRVDTEFGARLEEMRVEEVESQSRHRPEPPEGATAAAQSGGRGGGVKAWRDGGLEGLKA